MPDGASLLDKLFPTAVPYEKRRRTMEHPGNPQNLVGGIRGPREVVPTRWSAIYTLQLRGLSNEAIAEALGMAPNSVSRIVTDERFIAYAQDRLAALDEDFVKMKPLAFAALRSGLSSSDENTALRASEQWFRGAGFGGYSKHERPATTATAEDIARALLSGGPLVQVNTQVNVAPSDRDE